MARESLGGFRQPCRSTILRRGCCACEQQRAARISYRFLVSGWSAKPLVSAHDRIMGTHRPSLLTIPRRRSLTSRSYRGASDIDPCPACNGHSQTIADWEAVALWLDVRRQNDWQEQMHRKFVDQVGPTIRRPKCSLATRTSVRTRF